MTFPSWRQDFFMDLITWGYFGLFGGSFVSATLIPFPSEGLLISFFEMDYAIWTCVIIATLGNTLGGFTNYFLGYAASSEKVINRLKLNDAKLKTWEKRFSKSGHFLGLLAWIPIVGDPMILALGVLKVKFWPLAIMIFIGKLARYIILALIYLSIF